MDNKFNGTLIFTFQDGSQYKHCDECNKCVKPSRTHCTECNMCVPQDHKCGETLSTGTCSGVQIRIWIQGFWLDSDSEPDPDIKCDSGFELKKWWI